MLKDIHIQNYRGIKDLKIKDFKRINLLVGDNNSGKTSVLEAILLLMQPRNPILLLQFDYYRNLDLSEGNLLEIFDVSPVHFGENSLWEKLRYSCFNKDISNQIVISSGQELLSINFDLKAKNFGENNGVNLNLNFDPTIPQSVTFLYSGNEEETGFSAGVKTNIKFSHEINRAISDAGSFIRVGKKRSRELVGKLSKFLKEKPENKQKILNILSQIEPRISDIFPDAEKPKNPSIAVRVDGIDGTITLDHFGDGTIIVLAQILEIYHSKNSVVLIDEIENGLHWKTQRILWKAVIKAAEDNNVQIIATTHSREMISALSDVCEEFGEKDFVVFSLDKDGDKNYVNTYAGKDLQFRLSAGGEIR